MSIEQHALLIGINQYSKVENAKLTGCLNDVKLMRSLLVERFGFKKQQVRTLCDTQATQAGIRRELSELAARVTKDDVVVLFFAGHASQMADPRQPERMIESIVSHDSGRGTEPNRDIVDEEIDQWVQRINEKTPHATLIFDCCHSGAVTRDTFGEATRELEFDTRSAAEMFGGEGIPSVLAAVRTLREPGGREEDPPSRWVRGRRDAVLIAACRADEFANEHKALDGMKVVRHGALTYFLSRALLRMGSGSTWRDVFEQLVPELNARYGRQHPQLEGKIDTVLFGREEIRPASYLRVLSVSGETVELAGGAAHGVTSRSLWTLRSAGARHRGSKEETARVRVTSVEAARCQAEIEDGGGKTKPRVDQRAFLIEQRLPEPGLLVQIEATEAKAEQQKHLAQLIEESGLLKKTRERSTSDVLIRCLPPRDIVTAEDPCPGLGRLREWTWAAVGGDGRLAVRCRKVRPQDPAQLVHLVEDLERVARYRQLLSLDNPEASSPLRGKVRLRVRRWHEALGTFVDAKPEPGDGFALFREGERADFEIHNDSAEEVWCSLLQFGCDYRISLVGPRPGHPTHRPGQGLHLGPGEVWSASEYYLLAQRQRRLRVDVSHGLPLTLPPEFPWAAEADEDEDVGLLYLKLLVTPQSTDFEFLEQGASRTETGPLHPLQELARLYATGHGKRNFVPELLDEAPEQDWTSVNVPLGIRR